MNILFVDDNDTIAQTVQAALRRRGHSCETTGLGKQAIALAQKKTYDIVVLDIELPDMDGFHVIRRLKLESIKTPVLLQSGLSGLDFDSEGFALEQKRFLPKPFSVSELIERINAVVDSSKDTEREDSSNPVQSDDLLADPNVELDPGLGDQRDIEQPGGMVGAQRRRHSRNSMFGAALIMDADDKWIACTILDLSESGAALRLSDPDQACSTLFTLKNLGGPEWRCELRWRRGDKLGVEFK